MSTLPPPLPEEEDRLFFTALSEAGVLEELGDTLRLVLSEQAGVGDEEKRRLDLVELYYAASGDAETCKRRRLQDRFFAHHDDQATSAKDLVAGLREVLPEISQVHLARIGGDDGPLVLRSGELFAAVADELDEDPEEDGGEVTVRGLVHAMNVLLDRVGVRERLVALPGDGQREVYVGLPLASAMVLCRDGLLDADDPEELMDSAAW
ncbi:MAG: hypothetical protein GXP55_13645 [Deltaproteobacteria bacterium]|nr:hypothetical protein [Deltaproteobacteria bacterium]